jgi:hypothetical protein
LHTSISGPVQAAAAPPRPRSRDHFQLDALNKNAAMMGVYGMLAMALLVFCLRYLLRPED